MKQFSTFLLVMIMVFESESKSCIALLTRRKQIDSFNCNAEDILRLKKISMERKTAGLPDFVFDLKPSGKNKFKGIGFKARGAQGSDGFMTIDVEIFEDQQSDELDVEESEECFIRGKLKFPTDEHSFEFKRTFYFMRFFKTHLM